MDLYRNEGYMPPSWLIIPAVLGVMYSSYSPWNLYVFLLLTHLLSVIAPIGAVIVAVAFGIFCWTLSVWSMYITTSRRSRV